MIIKKLSILYFLILSAISINAVSDINQSSIRIITNSPLTSLAPNKFCESEICLELINLIDNAEDSIDFAVYGLRGQDEVLSALINAKKKRR